MASAAVTGRSTRDGQPGFLERLANAGDARGGGLRIAIGRERLRQHAVLGIDAAAGEHRGAAGKAHFLGALDHQQLAAGRLPGNGGRSRRWRRG